MTTSRRVMNETERTVTVIRKCFSAASLITAGQELGIVMGADTNLFDALVMAGKALNHARAVQLVALQLDAGNHPVHDPDADLRNGKIERRRPRQKGHRVASRVSDMSLLLID